MQLFLELANYQLRIQEAELTRHLQNRRIPFSTSNDLTCIYWGKSSPVAEKLGHTLQK